ncbi:MAG: hypothetical protein L0271_01090, partial [Gemmatimonadetes bacterium]|nr:hypothetical protein [Gemmatimonadota bacterium]
MTTTKRMVRRHGTAARRAAVLLAFFATIGGPATASAQDELRAECAATIQASQAAIQFCRVGTYALETFMVRTGLASAAGNPTPGTASTFGMKIGPLPRMSAAARLTILPIELPPVFRSSSAENPDGLILSLNLDGSVGLFTGFSPGATVGGLLSVDLLATASVLRVPGSEGFNGGHVLAWAAGARVGITRESFTAPGISVSGMYRRFADVSYGSFALNDTDTALEFGDHHAWNVRGAIGKRLSLLALTGGVGYDWQSAFAAIRVTDPALATRDIEATQNG